MALSAAGRAIVALTTRIVPSPDPPMTSRDVAKLQRSIDLGRLAGLDAAELARLASVPVADAERIARLLDRATAAALAVEALEQSGSGRRPSWTPTTQEPCASGSATRRPPCCTAPAVSRRSSRRW